MLHFIRSHFENMGEETSEPLPIEEIESGYKQTLSRLWAWNYLLDRFQKLICDVDGRLLVSSEATKATDATQSDVNVTNLGVNVLSANGSRRQMIIQNTGVLDAYITFGSTPTLHPGMLLKANVAYSDDVYVGQVTAITVAGVTVLDVVEMITDID